MIESKRRRPRRLLNQVCAFALVLGTPALARSGDPTDSETAQALFDEARQLMKVQEYSKACSLFERSQALDPGGGTILNLAICHERLGKFATASKELQLALERAERDERIDRIRTARKHLNELADKLSYLLILGPRHSTGCDVAVELDGISIRCNEFGSSIPIDPGSHEIVIHREMGPEKTINVVIGPRAERQTIDLTSLSSEPEPSSNGVVTVSPTVPNGPRRATGEQVVATLAPSGAGNLRFDQPLHQQRHRWFGYALLGGGAAATGFGAYFALKAWSLKRDSDGHFDGRYCTNPSCVADWNAANRMAYVADAFLLVGIAAIGIGGYLTLVPESQTWQPVRASWTFSASAQFAALSFDTRY